MNSEEHCEVTFSVSWVHILIRDSMKNNTFIYFSCRILHLAIIHEEEYIAQQLIELFPTEVLDIQNNLYQVRSTT